MLGFDLGLDFFDERVERGGVHADVGAHLLVDEQAGDDVVSEHEQNNVDDAEAAVGVEREEGTAEQQGAEDSARPGQRGVTSVAGRSRHAARCDAGSG